MGWSFEIKDADWELVTREAIVWKIKSLKNAILVEQGYFNRSRNPHNRRAIAKNLDRMRRDLAVLVLSQ